MATREEASAFFVPQNAKLNGVIMENKLTKAKATEKEIKDALELIEGCDSVAITYGVDNSGKMHKIVSFFDRTPHSIQEFEELGLAHEQVLAKNPSMSLVKQFDYKLDGIRVVKCFRDYVKVLLRTIPGFVKDDRTDDQRHVYEQRLRRK